MRIFLGLLGWLALSGVMFATARYAMYPDHLTSMMNDLADRLDRPRETFAPATAFLVKHVLRLRQFFYGLAALFFLLACIFLYKNLRRLNVEQDPNYQSLPYSMNSGGMPGAGGQAYGGAQPYAAQPGAAAAYGGGQPAQPGAWQPAGAAAYRSQPYGSPAYGQPAPAQQAPRMPQTGGPGAPYGRPAGAGQPYGAR